MKVRKLGRGLDILLDKSRRTEIAGADAGAAGERREEPHAVPHERSPALAAASPEAPLEATPGSRSVIQVPIHSIQANPHQPRLTFDRKELEALAASISKEGILQPILVRNLAAGSYQLIAGERRLRAAQLAGLELVPAIEVGVEDDRMLELALVENLHREDLNPIDTARAYEALMRLKEWTQETLAQSLGISRASISNTIRLLELPEVMQNALIRGQIQMGHAKILLSIPSEKDRQSLFEKIAEDRLSVRELELARESIGDSGRGDRRDGPAGSKKRSGARKPANVTGLEEELSRALGTKVTIAEKKGRGVLRIEFYGPEDFNHLRKLLLSAHK